MIDVMDAKDLYLSHFNAASKYDGDDRLHLIRTAAIERFAELGFPTPRDEEWRFTPLASLAEVPFQPADAQQASDLSAKAFRDLLPKTGPTKQIVLVNGRFAPRFSNLGQ